MPDINANEATATGLRVIEDLKKLGWKVNRLFEGRLDEVVQEMSRPFHLPRAA